MMQEIYPYFIKFHVFFSALFLLIACTISVHSLLGWIKKSKYGRFENLLRKAFLISLSIDLILGIILYFFLQKPEEAISAQKAMKFSALRFWSVQHFSNMIFVVILSQIGSVFIRNTENQVTKYKYSFIYFGIATLIILVSVGLFMLRR